MSVYYRIVAKRAAVQAAENATATATATAGPSKKPRYEYDSDEEVDVEGTWEHKKRKAEMAKTAGRNHC